MNNETCGYSFLKPIWWARRVRRFAARLLDRSETRSPQYLLSQCVASAEGQVVQIGSNDGETNDPIRQLLLSRHQWRALFVEPVPYLYERLTRNYPCDPRFVFENVAVSDEKAAAFYWVDASAKQHLPDLPPWFDQLGSFQREHITKHLNGILEPFIVSATVRCMTLSELLVDHAIRQVDILHIDTEGHDWKVLSQLDLTACVPDVILYEHRHLSQADKQSSLRFLEGKYDLYDLGRDYFAIAKAARSIRRDAVSVVAKQRVTPLTVR
jgi:FkbM family methyltransferase